MIVRELIARLGFDTDLRGVKKWEQGAQKVQTRASGLATQLRGMFAAVAAWQGVKSVVAIADEMQSLRARIGMLPQTIGDAGLALDELGKHANATRQDLVAYGTFYVKAGNAVQDFITDQKQLTQIVDGAAMGLAAGGATAVEQKQAFFQLGQAIGSPTVQMEEMNTLIDVAPDLFRSLGKAIPGAEGNLKKFISTGKVTGRMLAEGLMKVLPEFEVKMRNIPMTVGQASQRINNKWGLMVDKLNRDSMFVTKAAYAITDAFDAIERGVDAISKQFGGLGNIVRFVGEVFVASMGVKAVKAILGMNAASWKLLLTNSLLFAGLLIGVAIIDDLITWFRGGNSVIGDLVGNTDEAKNAFVGFFAVLATGAGIFYGVKAAIVTARAAMIAWQGLVTLVTALQWVWNFAMSANPFGILVIAIGALIAAGALLVANWTAVKDFFAGFLGGIGQKVVEWVKSIGSFFGGGEMNANINQNVSGVGPGAMAQGTGKGGNVLNKNTTVNMTVPPGTPAEQQKYLQGAAQKAFAGGGGLGSAEMGVYAP